MSVTHLSCQRHGDGTKHFFEVGEDIIEVYVYEVIQNIGNFYEESSNEVMSTVLNKGVPLSEEQEEKISDILYWYYFPEE